MPKAVYEELKGYVVTMPVLYDNVSVLILDFVGFLAVENYSSSRAVPSDQ